MSQTRTTITTTTTSKLFGFYSPSIRTLADCDRSTGRQGAKWIPTSSGGASISRIVRSSCFPKRKLTTNNKRAAHTQSSHTSAPIIIIIVIVIIVIIIIAIMILLVVVTLNWSYKNERSFQWRAYQWKKQNHHDQGDRSRLYNMIMGLLLCATEAHCQSEQGERARR